MAAVPVLVVGAAMALVVMTVVVVGACSAGGVTGSGCVHLVVFVLGVSAHV